jgi:hypothetical protein
MEQRDCTIEQRLRLDAAGGREANDTESFARGPAALVRLPERPVGEDE